LESHGSPTHENGGGGLTVEEGVGGLVVVGGLHGIFSHCPYGLGYGLKFKPDGHGMTIGLRSSLHWMYELHPHGFQ